MDEELETLRFALAETKESIISEIIKVIPELKLEWEILKDDNGKEHYRCRVGNVNVDVHEDRVFFDIDMKTVKANKTYETFRKAGKKKVRNKIGLYKRIQERLSNNEEIRFYKRVLRSLNGQYNSQKERNEVTFTEQKSDN